MNNPTERARPLRSMALLPEERKVIQKKVKESTKYDVAIFLGISRPTLDRILTKGTGKQSVIISIKQKLSEVA